MDGVFITFEGPDGAGKTTQLHLLSQRLQTEGYPVLQTREPGGTEISHQIRQIILNPQHKEMKAQTEILLYAASRAQHVLQKIKPALTEGKIVLCDRFVDASIAYQGYGLGFGQDVIKQVNLLATGGLHPNRTYMIDIPPEMGRARIHVRKESEFGQELDRIEQKELEYHRRVRYGFQQLAKQEERVLLIDGRESQETIQEIIFNDISAWLETKRRA